MNYKYVSATRSGRLIDFSNPDAASIDPFDIALGLSKSCRFNGQIDGFYSVAQHSVMVASRLPEELKAVGLLHDASEAYMADIVRPAKNLIDDYMGVEECLMEAIFDRFKLDINMLKHVLVVEADNRALMTERKFLIPDWHANPGVVTAWAPLDARYAPYDDVHGVVCLPWQAANEIFLDEFEALIGFDIPAPAPRLPMDLKSVIDREVANV
jgi:hypothetical protein